jgi:DNA polymerase kappa
MTSLDQPEERPPSPSTEETPELPGETEDVTENLDEDALKTLKYSLLGPSLLKAGQDKVDQSKVRPNSTSLLGIINTKLGL